VNKKEVERIRQEHAERESKARSESEHRQERISVLWKELRQEFKQSPDSIKELAKDELGKTLLELLNLQRCEIEHLRAFCQLVQQIRNRFPIEWKKLSSANTCANLNEDRVCSVANTAQALGKAEV
jgi:hypothetical protein